MKQIFSSLYILFLSASFSIQVLANQGEPAMYDTASIRSQLNFMVSKAYTHEEYKIIKTVVLNKFKLNLLDSLDRYENTILALKTEAGNIEQLADSTLKVLQQTQQDLDKALRLKNSFSFIGIHIHKLLYNTIMWSMVLGLGILLIAGLLILKRNKQFVKNAQIELNTLREEFENHRKNSREREEKMARKHLDEILKYKKQ